MEEKTYSFLCSNAYHILVSKYLASKLRGKKYLYLYTRMYGLVNNSILDCDDWVVIDTWYVPDGVKNILQLKYHDVFVHKKRVRAIEPDVIFYFVDKDVLSQFYLRHNKRSLKILIEEGIGLYSAEVFKSYKKFLIKSFSFIKLMLNAKLGYAEQGGNQYHDVVCCRYPGILPSIKKKQAKVLKYDSYMCEKDYIEVVGDSNKCKCYIQSNGKPSILYIGSGVELFKKWMTVKDYEYIMTSIISQSKKYDYNFYVKPHPKESKEIYSSIIDEVIYIEDPVPVEIYAYKIKPIIVMSFMSSALLNLYWIPSKIYLYDLIDSEFPNKRILRDICMISTGYESPKSIEKVMSVVEKLSYSYICNNYSDDNTYSNCLANVVVSNLNNLLKCK